jgi:hypothetical protein
MKNDKKNEPILPEETVKDVVKRGGNNPTGIGGFGSVDTTPGDNARYLRHSLTMLDLPAIDISDPVQVELRIRQYFEQCVGSDMKPTVSGMALALGVDRKTLYDWSRGNYRDVTHSPIVKKAMNVLDALWEDYMMNGKINPVSGIFLGKNHFGYTDKQEIVVKPENPLGEQKSPDEIKQRYLAENPETPIDET